MNKSMLVGVPISLIIGLAAFGIVKLLLLGVGAGFLLEKIPTSAQIVLSLGIATGYYTWCINEIAVGWRGMLLFLGSRMKENGTGWNEGLQWTLKPFVYLKPVNCQGDALELKDLDEGLFTKDHIQIGLIGKLPFRVADPYVYSGMMDEKPKELLRSKLEAAARNTIKGMTLSQLLKADRTQLSADIKTGLLAGLSTTGSWGYDLTGELQIQDTPVLDKGIVSALSAKTREKLEGAAEQIQSDKRHNQALRYAGIPREAVAAALVDAGKQNASIQQINIEGLGPVGAGLNAVGSALLKAIEKIGARS